VTHPPSTSPFAARVVLVSLIALAGLTPPEARGEAMAGCALLVGLAGVLGWSTAPRVGARVLAVAILLAIPLARAADAPGAALEPWAVASVAAGAGLAAAGLAGVPGVAQSGATALALSAGLVAIHALYQKVWGLERALAAVAADPLLPDRDVLLERLAGGRAFASFITPAALGGYLALALPVTIALALEARGRKRRVWIALLLLQAAAFVATASATAAGALVGATILAACAGTRSRRAVLAVAALGGLLLAAVAIQRGGIALRPDAPEGPWRLRAGNLRAAWAMASDHPWTGVGPGGYAENYPAYRAPGDNETRHVHDLPLELAAELGWPAGLAVTVLFFVLFGGPLWRETRGPAWRRGLAVGLAAFALQNLADFTAFLPSVLWLASLMRGCLAAAGEPHPPASVPDRLAAGVGLAGVTVAVVVSALAGLADEARLDARFAAAEGDDPRVLALAERARTLAPWNPDAALLHARAVERIQGSRAPGLLELADRAVALSPVRPAARELRARVRRAHGDLAGAYADLRRAAALYPLQPSYPRDAEALRDDLEPLWSGKGGEP
jgi:O-antigen ligase